MYKHYYVTKLVFFHPQQVPLTWTPMNSFVLSSALAVVVIVCLSGYTEGGCDCSKYLNKMPVINRFSKCLFKCVRGGMNSYYLHK